MEETKRFIRRNVTIDELRSKQEKKQRRRTTFYMIFFLTITLAFFAVFFFVFFRVNEIQIVGNEIYSDEQITECLPFSLGDNLFSFDSEKAESSLRKSMSYIGSVSITRKLPATVIVEVSERQDDLQLALGDNIYLLSGDLQVLSMVDSNQIIKGVTNLKAKSIGRCIVGEELTFLDERTGSDLTELYQYLEAYNLTDKITEIDISSRFSIYINYEDRFTVYLEDTDDLDIKIPFLIAVLEKLSASDKGTIDLSDPREASVRLSSS